MGYYLTATICTNGHCIDSTADVTQSTKFCAKCGAGTIAACPDCHAKIRGHYKDENFPYFGKYHVPAYCINCGKPYPWTVSALESAVAIIREEESIDGERQEQLVESLPDLITETPKTNLAAVRFKKFLASAGAFTAEAVRQFAIDFGCELAKKQLGL